MVALYLGVPGSGKSTLMQRHVYATRAEQPTFLVVDHDGSWVHGRVFTSAAEFRAVELVPRWCVFRGVPPLVVAQLAIDIGDTVYVDDECDVALTDKWKASPLREILKRGRHMPNVAGEVCTVSAMLATHRPSNLPGDVTSLMTRVYVGRLQSFADADRVYREGWLPEARSPREARELLNARRPGEFTMWP